MLQCYITKGASYSSIFVSVTDIKDDGVRMREKYHTLEALRIGGRLYLTTF